jgi:hypothetical protein
MGTLSLHCRTIRNQCCNSSPGRSGARRRAERVRRSRPAAPLPCERYPEASCVGRVRTCAWVLAHPPLRTPTVRTMTEPACHRCLLAKGIRRWRCGSFVATLTRPATLHYCADRYPVRTGPMARHHDSSLSRMVSPRRRDNYAIWLASGMPLSGSSSLGVDRTKKGGHDEYSSGRLSHLQHGSSRLARGKHLRSPPAVAYSVRKNWIRSCFSWLVKLMLNRLL